MRNSFSWKLLQSRNNLFPQLKMIHYYRYISYILTSSFYILWGEYSLTNKVAVILFLGFAAVILDYIYINHRDNIKIIKLLVIIETLGNIAVLLPSGGICSPYIWYSLNAVLVSSCFLNAFFLYINILAYTIILSFVSLFLSKSSGVQIESFLLDNSNLILSYILIITAINFLMMLVKRISNERLNVEKINGELIKANKMLADSMADITSLYQNVHAFVNAKNNDGLGEIIAEYIQKITKAPFAFIYTGTKGIRYTFETKGKITAEAKASLLNAVISRSKSVMAADVAADIIIRDKIAGRDFILSSVSSSGCFYGILGIETADCGEIIENQNIDQIKMLASLSAILIESFKIEEVNRNLLISEEQHRIANEIHDGVSQRLFYTSCKISALAKKAGNNKQDDLVSELHTIQESMITAIRELRETIYNNDAKSKDSSSFEDCIKRYLNEINELNEANIDLKMNGSFEYISYDLKKVILRLLGEACGNAIRHGKSRNISIKISGDIEKIEIEICDDGNGFDLCEKVRNSSLGLGIRNMNSLVYSFNGRININSQLCKGTIISVSLPLVCQSKGGKVV